MTDNRWEVVGSDGRSIAWVHSGVETFLFTTDLPVNVYRPEAYAALVSDVQAAREVDVLRTKLAKAKDLLTARFGSLPHEFRYDLMCALSDEAPDE